MGTVRASKLIRTVLKSDRPSSLAQAIGDVRYSLAYVFVPLDFRPLSGTGGRYLGFMAQSKRIRLGSPVNFRKF